MIRIAIAALFFQTLAVVAQPASDPLGPSVIDTGSDIVMTHDFTLPSPDAGPDYRVGVLVPRGPAPEAGFPVVYMLDGQAVLELLDDGTLAGLPDTSPAVIVTLGYDTDARFATLARTRDYTPPAEDGQPVVDPRDRPAGEAAAFLQRLRADVLPRVAQIAPVDAGRSTLWGHSYGGLFVLYAAMQADSPFAQHVSASPSLWWDYAKFMARLERAAPDFPNRPLALHQGAEERARASRPTNPNAQKLVQMRAALSETAFEDLAASLAGAGVPVRETVFPGLSHGESFGASALHTLNAVFAGRAP
ncbi:alpha/beta hydrolase [Sagittula sp. SSi028]|uniref:alpha/beta hydrolase n=1 Tax=Sagittula sp. SSi028 TaxID=3400636 RepID=UPI003AF86BEF